MIWLIYLGYLSCADIDSLWISLIFVPVFGVITWSAIRSNNIVLQTFAVFMFIGQAIGAPFFWLNRSNYGGSSFSSVGNFQFDLGEFFLIYVWVAALYATLVWSTRKCDAYIWPGRVAIPRILNQKYCTEAAHTSLRSEKVIDILLVLFIVLFMLPLTLYMSANNIGTMGLLNDPLPYRLTGIMYYMRLYLGPILILWLFAKSTRSLALVGIILSYAFIAGLTSASRSVLLISMFSAGYFAIVDRQKTKIALVTFVGVLGFLFTSASRDYTYSNSVFVLSDAFEASLSTFLNAPIGFFDIIGGIANRFYGAQDMVLSYQFVREDTWQAMFNYFFSGGRADAIVPDLGRDFYGINLEGTGLGVGIGTMAYILILSHSNILVIPFALLALSFLISAGNQLLNYALAKAEAAKLLSHSVASGPIRLTLGGFMAFSLYSSSLNYFYTFAQLILMLLFTQSILNQSKAAGK